MDENEGAELLRALVGDHARITRAQALEIPAVSACVHLIAGTIAMLPIRMYEKRDGNSYEVTNDERVYLLNVDTGNIQDGVQWKKAMIEDYLLDGAGYTYINKGADLKAKSLHYVKHSDVSVSMGADPITRHCRLLVGGNAYDHYDFLKIVRQSSNGVIGKGVVEENNQLLAIAYEMMRFEKSQMAKGGNKKGFLKSKKKLTELAMESLKRAVANLYSNNNYEKMIVLNDGLDFQESSATPTELQLNENKQTIFKEICTVFTVSPSMLLGGASDRDEKNMNKYAIPPILAEVEAALNKDLLLASEQSRFYFAFDTTEIVRGDLKERFETYEIGLKNSFLQVDDVRAKENLNPLGLRFIKLGLNDVLYDTVSNTVYTPNTNQTATLDGSPHEEGEE